MKSAVLLACALLAAGCKGRAQQAPQQEGVPVTVAQVAQHIAAIIGKPELVDLGGLPYRPGEPKSLVADTKKTNQQLKLLWIGCGTDDTLYKSVQDFATSLQSKGVKTTWKSTGGAHTWLVWRKYLAEVAPMLFG